MQSITQLAIPHQGIDISCNVSVSIGAVQVIPHESTSIEQIMQQADKRLYLVKNDTRNAVSLLELDRYNQ